MFYDLLESSVNIQSGKIDYVAFGKGQKNLIIIPGLNIKDVKGAGASLAVMYKIFAKEYRVYCFDRRATVKEDITIRDLAEDIYMAAKTLGVDSADVFGVSQGGMIAMIFTLEHPECVNRLVLGVTSSKVNDDFNATVNKWISCARNNDFITINRDTFYLMYTEKSLKKYKLLMPLLVRMVKPKDPERFAFLASSMLDFDCYDRLSEIKCPVLVVGAEKDRIVTGAASRAIAEKLNCEIYMYSEYGHAAYEEAKDFNERIYEFLIKNL